MNPTLKKSAVAFFALLFAGITAFLLPESCPGPAKNMVFIFLLAGFLWVFEIIPLFVTSLVVVLLEIFLLPEPSQLFLSSFSNPIIFLFLGGFVLAAALQKHRLDKKLAERLLLMFGKKPLTLMAGFMGITAFFAFWISATATTAMMLALIVPILSQIPPHDPFKKALVLSIPIGARIGGLCTPIGTPPNAIAMGILEQKGLDFSFLSWMGFGGPLAVILFFVAVSTLFFLYKPTAKELNLTLPKAEAIGPNGKVVLIISLLTIALWLTSGFHHISEAIVSLIGISLYFSLGCLNKDDLKKIDWDILILMWGGLALGEGMESSGLTQWFMGNRLFDQKGIILLSSLCLLATFISTFMSNATAANLLLPLAAAFPAENQILFTVAVALCCSFDIPLPISSPPNAMAFSTRAVTVKDLLKSGIPITIAAVMLIIIFSKILMTYDSALS